MTRAGDVRTREQVNAALDGCDHLEIRRITPTFPGGDVFWSCFDCGQRFGPIFYETPRRNGDPTIKEVFGG